ncbi:MAG: TonB-dependent receptor [Sphingomonas sp. SCN 67-18]|uniref:TonB-dependent receptor domain-containing protein n=1 Tax=uncultured Sphingomonas sp. TaxID=158754 RepID=UPI00086CEE52|nr:TonB-dependent receptor [Sphingomonas sp. SCN 67-18]ODU21446.1 MAG: TonB-dependent receptor [Sphingomonas sp. SCN 67-18]
MTHSLTLGGVLLISTALVSPAALAQTAAPVLTAAAATADAADAADAAVDDAADIVVIGKNIPDAIRATPEVVSVLSAGEIARTGEGDIAGALGRVTGLSVVGSGYVYVRGLGDRYSLALLNGSPLPSPEPLKRVVPLDIFPTSILESAVVQKSYSARYPGEFGGGVIDLITKAIPDQSFVSVGIGASGDSETTGKLGYTYFGSRTDWTGFDNGTRDVPSALRAAMAGGNRIVEGETFDTRTIQGFTASLVNAPTSLLQRNGDIPANASGDFSIGKVIDAGDMRLGLIAAAGYSNSWRTKDARQQVSNGADSIGQDFRTVSTDNRIVVNGLLGLGAEFGDHKIRWTNLYIRDTLKQAQLSAGYDTNVPGADPVDSPDFLGTPPVLKQKTYWFERQLIDTQLVGEFKFGDVGVNLRGTYANSQRESPYERSFSYVYDAGTAQDYVNNLSAGGQSADIAFSDLNENVYAGAIDLAWNVPADREIVVSAGYSYGDTRRTSVRRDFQFFRPDGALNLAVAQERPDYLLSDYNIYTYNIQLREVTPNDATNGAGAYKAGLRVHGGYAQVEGEIVPLLRGSVGVRYEDASQSVTPVNLFGDTPFTGRSLANDYWLPAATLTWNFAEDMQLRLHASKTIARPQFREMALQLYQDYESDRQFFGNPNLNDSELFNAEARYEYYFDRGQRLSVAGFYKKIDNPIEAFGFLAGGGQLQTSFANAPSARLYGGEVELLKYFPLGNVSDAAFFTTRRLVLVANYTYSKSELKVGAGDTVVDPFGATLAASSLFNNGDPLTGQSDHIANVQIGLEDEDRLSQQTFMLTYASKRVTSRGPRQGDVQQPDIVEDPGLRLDFVAREGVSLFGGEAEIKFEVRNITGRGYREFQQGANRRIHTNLYNVGTSFSLGASIKF